MVFKEWDIFCLYEYAKDKILATTMSHVLFLIQDFDLVKMINNEGYFDQFKSGPVPLLDFDEENFPFLLICGFTCVSIMNVKTGEHRPLINGSGILVGYLGLTCLFVKREEYG